MTIGISAGAIVHNLNTCLVGKQVLAYSSVTSTNDVALDEARRGAAAGTVVIAGKQTAGKGRLNRKWESSEGDLFLSVILYPKICFLPYLIMISSVAVLRTVRQAGGIAVQIKWPNDIFCNGKKIGGVLIENQLKGAEVEYAVIGIGLNVNFNPEHSFELATTATSLAVELGKEISVVDVAQRLLRELDRLYLNLSEPKAIFEEWQDNLLTMGKAVRVTWGNQVTEGFAEAVAVDGSLLVRECDGKLTRVTAGDVTLRN